MRVESVHILMLELRARAALGTARRAAKPGPLLKVAELAARQLERMRMTWSAPKAHIVRAGIAVLQGDKAAAVGLLARAAAEFEAVSMKMFRAAAMRRQGELLSGPEGKALIDSADAWMATQKVQNPAQMTAAYTPAFAD